MLTHLDLFSGIGGFSLGLQRTNEIRTIAYCEIDEYCRQVLRKHFGADINIIPDVKALKTGEFKGIDIISAGFPCQDLSVSQTTRSKGLSNERSGLFYEVIRIARETGATFILFENSPQLIQRDEFRQEFIKSVQECGYDLQWHLLSARDFGLPHKRTRAFVICWKRERFTDPFSFGRLCNEGVQLQKSVQAFAFGTKENEALIHFYHNVLSDPEKAVASVRDFPDIRKCDGLSTEIHRITALGNSLVPQIATLLGNALLYSLKEIKNDY